MKLCSIASGSSGNCVYICSETTGLLVDAGISKKRIEEGLSDISVNPSQLKGILITHEHSDHIKGLGVMARKYELPIYATKGTIQAVKKMNSLGKIDDDLYCTVYSDHPFQIGDISIQPIATSHDAAEPVAYKFRSEGKQAAVITDLGMYDNYIVDNLQNLDLIMLEANHDVRMLQVGSYPYYLKQRILSSRGHLSNDSCAQLLSLLIHDKMKHIVLGHLSQENNLEELAFETIRQEIQQIAQEKGCLRPDIEIAHRNCHSSVIEV